MTIETDGMISIVIHGKRIFVDLLVIQGLTHPSKVVQVYERRKLLKQFAKNFDLGMNAAMVLCILLAKMLSLSLLFVSYYHMNFKMFR